MEKQQQHIVGIVSSVSARKLKCLGSEPSQLGLARAGKFQLELISSKQLKRAAFGRNVEFPFKFLIKMIYNRYF